MKSSTEALPNQVNNSDIKKLKPNEITKPSTTPITNPNPTPKPKPKPKPEITPEEEIQKWFKFLLTDVFHVTTDPLGANLLYLESLASELNDSKVKSV